MRLIIINKNMKYHFIYKTSHKNGKYYIGRHSTENLDDGYIGSGRWPASIKDRTNVSREILEFVDNVELLKQLEGKYLQEHYGKPGCMNATPDPVGFDTDNNPMKRPEVAAKLSGDNHWSRLDPESAIKLKNAQLKVIDEGRHHFVGDKNPNKDGRNAKLAMNNGTHVNLTNNPSKWRSEQGIHHWQDGKSPNADGKLNKKLVAEGRHNFLGPDLNNKRIKEGTHNLLGSKSNLDRLVKGTHPSQMKKTCEHCGKIVSTSMYARWHGDRCQARPDK
jgi:hypothetical protein